MSMRGNICIDGEGEGLETDHMCTLMPYILARAVNIAWFVAVSCDKQMS